MMKVRKVLVIINNLRISIPKKVIVNRRYISNRLWIFSRILKNLQ